MDLNILDFGAKAELNFMNTDAIQKAIDKCNETGGGRVVISNGTYMTGTFIMKSNVELHLTENAALLGSPNCEDYKEIKEFKHIAHPEFLPRGRSACLIFADECENISITGKGKIDCNGDKFVEPIDKSDPRYYGYPFYRKNIPTPPRIVHFVGCKKIKITDIILTNLPAGWGYWINDCDDVIFDRCKVLSSVDYMNNDGIHINSSRNVVVSDCELVCGDDCIAIRTNNSSLAQIKPCENIVVKNCSMISNAMGIRLGWHNDGVIRNCSFTNIVMKNTSIGIGVYLPNLSKFKRSTDQGVESTHIENIFFSNIVMDDCVDSIYFNVPEPEDGNCLVADCDCIENITFKDIRSRSLTFPWLYCAKENVVKNITFSNCSFVKIKPENSENYKNNSSASFKFKPRDLQLHNIKNVVFNNTIFTDND